MMEQEINLGEAVRALQAEHGESFAGGLEQGKEMMARTLEARLNIERARADAVVEALLDARSIRWEGSAGIIPLEQTGVLPIVSARAEAGMWYL
jgi:hypothetical protein